MGDHRQMSSSTYTLNGTRKPQPDAILDDWKNYLRKVFNKSRRPDRTPETIDEYPESAVSSIPSNYGTSRPNDYSLRRAPGIGVSMFGRRLQDSVDETSGVAKFVLWCVEAISTTGDGLDSEAIYRTSGNQARIQEIVKQGENEMRETLQREDNVNVLTAALKLFFRQLLNPVIEYEDFSRALQTESPNEEIFLLVQGLPVAERKTLSFMMNHLQDVLDHHAVNTMDIPSLAVVFGPTLMRLSTNPRDMAFDMKQQNRIVEFLLSEHDSIFSRRDVLTKLDVHQQLHSGTSDSDSEANKKTVVDKTRPGTITYNTESSEEDENNGQNIPGSYENSPEKPVGDQSYSKHDNAEVKINTVDNIKPQQSWYPPEDASYYEDVESHAIAVVIKKPKNFFSAKLSNFMEDTKKKLVKGKDKPVKTENVPQMNEYVVKQEQDQEKQQQQHDHVTTGVESERHEQADVFENRSNEYAIPLKKSERNIPKDISTVDKSRFVSPPELPSTAPPKLPSTAPPIYKNNHIYTLDTYSNRQLQKSLEELNNDKYLISATTEIIENQQQNKPFVSDAAYHQTSVNSSHNNQTEAATSYSYQQQTVVQPQRYVSRNTSQKQSDSDSSSSMSNHDSGSDSEPDTRYNSLRSVPTAL